MSAKLEDAPFSLAGFLAWERGQGERYEFLDGAIVAMVGGTANHNQIAGNLYMALRRWARERPCRAFSESMKVLAAGAAHYPDVVLTCAPVAGSADVVDDPVLIVEVQSPSTARDDAVRKWANYQTLPGLALFAIVAQDRMRVEVYTRDGARWRYETLSLPDDRLALPGYDLEVALAAVYEGIAFETAG